MYKYDIVEYQGLYFIRRRLFGKFFPRYRRQTMITSWETKSNLIRLINLFGKTWKHKEYHTLKYATLRLADFNGTTKLKFKELVEQAEFKVHGN